MQILQSGQFFEDNLIAYTFCSMNSIHLFPVNFKVGDSWIADKNISNDFTIFFISFN